MSSGGVETAQTTEVLPTEIATEKEELTETHDPHYEPIISLPEVEVLTLEEDETEMLLLRAKLFRFDTQENPPEWKERGTGTVKILKHNIKNTARVVMRRDKTLKLCANHFIVKSMELKPSASCDRAWVYSVSVDYVDEVPRSELLAIKFANIENAQKWKDAFEEAKEFIGKCENDNNAGEQDSKGKLKEEAVGDEEKEESKEIVEKLIQLTVDEVK